MWWFIYGLVLGAGGMRLLIWAAEDNRAISWTVWPITIFALIFGTLAVQHFFASYKEMEPKAAWMGLLFMGIPAVIFAGIAIWLFIPS